MNYFPYTRPLGDKAQTLEFATFREGRDPELFGGTAIMFGSRILSDEHDYDASLDPQYQGLTQDFISLSRIEDEVPAEFENDGEAIAAIKNVIRMGFGDDPIFAGKGRDGKLILNPKNNDRFQVRNQLFLTGHHDLEESQRLGSMLGDRLLLPILEIVFNRSGTDSDKKELMDFAMYLFGQGISDYVKDNLKDVAKDCNDKCAERYDALYENIKTLRTYTEKKKMSFAEVHDTRHPVSDLNWLRPENQNTIVACYELLNSGGVDSMVKFCEFVSSCQGTYEEMFFHPENLSKNFWADIYAFHLVGQAEAFLNKNFQSKLVEAVPEAFRSKIHEGPVKTVTRVKAKRFDYSTLAEHFSELQALKADKMEHKQRLFDLKQEYIARCSTNYDDRTSESGIIDICRASVVLENEEELVEVFEAVKKEFPICRIKNGFHQDNDVTGSGYRDMKLNLLVSIEDEDGYECVQVTELQLTLKSFEDIKKLSHLPYSILRGDFD